MEAIDKSARYLLGLARASRQRRGCQAPAKGPDLRYAPRVRQAAAQALGPYSAAAALAHGDVGGELLHA